MPTVVILADLGIISISPPHKWADRDVAVRDGAVHHLYRNRLIAEGSNHERIAMEFQDTFQDETCQIVLSDEPDLYDEFKPSDDFEGGANNTRAAGISMTVKIAEPESDETDHLLLFKGFIDKTFALSRETDKITLKGVSVLKTRSQDISKVFNRDDYPDVEEDALGKVIPIVFGDFENDVDGEYKIRAYRITKEKWKASALSLGSVKNAILVREGKFRNVSFSTDLLNGEVTITGQDMRLGDQVYLQATGARASEGYAATTPADIALVILRDIMKFQNKHFVNFGQFDSYTRDLSMRRIVTELIRPEDLLQSLAREVGAVVSIRYVQGADPDYGIHLIPFHAAMGRLQGEVDAMKHLRDWDFFPGFREIVDPNRLYSNKFSWESDADFRSGFTEHDEEYETIGRQERTFKFEWVYHSFECDSLAKRELKRRGMRVVV